ncbi:hypothetical protein NDU88_005100 [Pleurodeles waltl]|uniref:Uncharacterized protein n=1 Tax=Pleurodeles waltl TaxID=8319 RepID=A0AAV7MIF0_PLEWA|nr:hypothetical protein NDU88_005100 [Pleurodeles waltl]
MDHVTLFMKFWIRKSLDKETRILMRAECLRPFIDNKSWITPNLDQERLSFLLKSAMEILGRVLMTGGDWLSAVECQGPNVTDRISGDMEEVSEQPILSTRKEVELHAQEATGADHKDLENKIICFNNCIHSRQSNIVCFVTAEEEDA